MMRLSPQRPIIATLGRGLADALACLLVLLTLLASPDVSRLTVGVFVSVPLEALLGVAILLLSPQCRATVAEEAIFLQTRIARKQIYG